MSRNPGVLNFKLCLTLTACVVGMLSGKADAADASWVSGFDSLWSTGGNWSTAPLVPGALGTTTNADTATFNTATGATVSVDATRNVRSLIFGPLAGAFTIGGAGANGGPALNLTSGGSITMQQGIANGVTIAAPLVLNGASATTAGTYTLSNSTLVTDTGSTANPVTAAATPKLNVTGGISGGTTSSTVTLTLAGTVGSRSAGNAAGALDLANTISGVISNGAAAGGLSVVVNGTVSGASGRYNAWNLTGVNTYTGNTTVTNGALYFNSLGNIGNASALGTGTNGTITVGSFLVYTGGAVTSNRTFTTTGGAFHNQGTGAMTLNGAFTNSNGITFRGSSAFIINGLISGVGAVANNGGLTTTLANNNNDFTGQVNVQDGTISFATISDANTTNSALGRGILIALGQGSTTPVGVLSYTGGTASTNRNIQLNNATASTGSGNGRILNNGTGTLTLNGWVRSFNADGTFDSKLEIGGTNNGIITGVIGGTGTAVIPTTASSDTSITKIGTGSWELQAANTYTGVTTVSVGSLFVTNTTGSGTGTGNVSVASGATLGGTGSITGSGSGSITLSSGSQLVVGMTHGLGGTKQDLVLGSLSAAANVAVSLNGTLRFDITGAGSFDPLGNVAYNDLATVNNDLLEVSTTGAISFSGGQVLISALDTSGWQHNHTWKLIDWSNAVSSGVNTAGLTLGTTSINGFLLTQKIETDGYYVTATVVPEPARIILLGLGLGFVLLRRKRGTVAGECRQGSSGANMRQRNER